MLFLLKLICCVGGTFICAGVVTSFMNWWRKQPIVEEYQTPFYITRTYKDIINGYQD